MAKCKMIDVFPRKCNFVDGVFLFKTSINSMNFENLYNLLYMIDDFSRTSLFQTLSCILRWEKLKTVQRWAGLEIAARLVVPQTQSAQNDRNT